MARFSKKVYNSTITRLLITRSRRTVKKNTKKNLICVLLTILVIAAYILIDGYGMLRNTLNFVRLNNGSQNATFFDPILRENMVSQFTEKNSAAVLDNMIETLISRLVILIIVIFPVVFSAVRYPISFRKKDASRIEKLITYFRPVFGFLFFYYILTIQTVFLHEPFTNYYSFGSWRNFFRIVAAFVVLAACILDWPVFV